MNTKVCKMAKRLAELKLREVGTTFRKSDGMCYTITKEYDGEESLVDKLDAVAIYYQGLYIPIAEETSKETN